MSPKEIFELDPTAFYNEISNANEITIEKLLLFAYGLIHFKLIEE